VIEDLPEPTFQTADQKSFAVRMLRQAKPARRGVRRGGLAVKISPVSRLKNLTR